jgi:hypothetical protein
MIRGLFKSVFVFICPRPAVISCNGETAPANCKIRPAALPIAAGCSGGNSPARATVEVYSERIIT